MKAGKLIAVVLVGFSGALLACASILGFDKISLEAHDSGLDVDRPDAGHCDYQKSFGQPNYVELGTGAELKWGAWFSNDESRVYYGSRREGDPSKLYAATRDGGRGAFASARLLGCCDAAANEVAPTLTEDAGVMVFAGTGASTYDLFITRWDNASNGYAPAKPLPLNSTGNEWAAFLAAGGQKLWFSSYRSGTHWDIYAAALTDDGGATDPIPVTKINSSNSSDDNPVLSADGHNLYFSSDRDNRNYAVWVAHRDDVSDDFNSWSTPVQVNVPEMLPNDEERPVWISPDECRLYYMLKRGKDDSQIFMAERSP